jgi:hypothetical protein
VFEVVEEVENPRLVMDGRREVLLIALLVCDAGNLMILIAVGENPIDDCKSPAVTMASFGETTPSWGPWRLTLSSGIARGVASSASKQFNNAFARRRGPQGLLANSRVCPTLSLPEEMSLLAPLLQRMIRDLKLLSATVECRKIDSSEITMSGASPAGTISRPSHWVTYFSIDAFSPAMASR